jgi:RNA polymerase sigma-70 factor (ECF subfamily)
VRVGEPREMISGADKMNIRRSARARRNEDMACNEIRGGDVGLRGVEEEWALLMRAAIDGDSTAYRRLLASLTPVLRTVTRRNCARIGLDGGEAEDIVQEVLLAIHLKRHTWDVDRPFGPWIMTIARNKLIDARRRRGNRLTLPIDDLADILTAEGSDDATDRGDLDRLLGGLGERQRDLVRSLSVEGRSVQETAERLKMSEGAVRVALHRAIKALAALYRGNGDEN